MIKYLYKSLVALILLSSIGATAQHRGVCGTIDHTLGERVLHNRKVNMSKVRSGDIVYIPVVFHNTAKDDGKSRLKVSAIIRQMEKLNRDYENSNADIIFYIDKINNVDDTDMFKQSLASGQIIALNRMKTERNTEGSGSLNVFITNSADHGGTSEGTVLGYYTPANDWLVVKKGQINDRSTTLTHEGGHFFSLPHTFSGWEFGDGKAYNPTIHGDTVFFTTCPGTNYPVELVDRSNCAYAGDLFCDTPPDFNFGLFNGDNCIFKYKGKVWDNKFELVEPMVNNYMSYFDYKDSEDCPPFIFTPEQVAAVKADVASSERAYIRHDFEPNTTAMSGDIVFTNFTGQDSTGVYLTPYYEDILIEWEPIEGASKYVIDVKGSGISSSVIIENGETSFLAPGLKKDKRYFCYIKPFNDGNFNSEGVFFDFMTGETIAGVKDIDQVNKLSIAPNPISKNESFRINLDAKSSFDTEISVRDLTGKSIYTQSNYRFNKGDNELEINTTSWAKGLYLVTLRTNMGQVTQKLIIQ